ncbi:hypothetical protein [Nostoc sp. PA-18-2419]|uniref:hypothetical protein n=1 Tax=Nostoc sp. PA-18-2419 TaxID=2575443 RepID=UPI0011090038|nr:hypothetical protein [Nostoc sp. PA-18-2419]
MEGENFLTRLGSEESSGKLRCCSQLTIFHKRIKAIADWGCDRFEISLGNIMKETQIVPVIETRIVNGKTEYRATYYSFESEWCKSEEDAWL